MVGHLVLTKRSPDLYQIILVLSKKPAKNEIIDYNKCYCPRVIWIPKDNLLLFDNEIEKII